VTVASCLQEPPAFKFQDDGEEVPAEPAGGPHFTFDDAGPLAFDFDGGDNGNDEAAGGEDDAPAEQETEDSDYMLDFTSSVYIAGLLHVLHNTTQDLGATLLHWSLWVDQLKMVCRLLSNKWTKDRFLQTCLKGHPLAGDIKRFRARVYEARWGSIWYAVGQLLHIQDILCQSWAKQAFCYGDADMNERREETEHSVNLEVVNEALRSPLFWAYCVAMDTVGEIFERLAFWGESCACHWEDDRLHGASRWQRGKALMQDMGQSTCPMRTLRAPECAAGEHFRILNRLMSLGHSALLLNPCVSGLSAGDRSVLLSDFARARQHVNTFLQVRLSFWEQLPWSLFAIGHHKRSVAIACAQRSLRQYANSPPDAEHHRLTIELLDHQSVAGVQMRLFAQGTLALEDMPCLLSWAAKMKFAAVTERWIESLHAQTKRMLATAPHATMLHVAWHGVQLPLRSRLLQKPELINEFAAHCARCRNPAECLKAVGLWRHPAVVDLRRRVPLRELNRSNAAALIEVLYHADAWSLHAALPKEEPSDDDGHDLGCGPGGGPGGGAGDNAGARGPGLSDAADGPTGNGAGRGSSSGPAAGSSGSAAGGGAPPPGGASRYLSVSGKYACASSSTPIRHVALQGSFWQLRPQARVLSVSL
jgi:hypothetical protein